MFQFLELGKLNYQYIFTIQEIDFEATKMLSNIQENIFTLTKLKIQS